MSADVFETLSRIMAEHLQISQNKATCMMHNIKVSSHVNDAVAIDCQLSLTNTWVRIPPGACEKVASDLR